METKIQSIDLTKLTNGAHFNFVQGVIERVEADEVVLAKITADLTNLKLAFEVEDGCLKISRKSLLTNDISDWDMLRDAFSRAYKYAVKAMLKLPAGDLLEYAKRLWQNIVDYNIDPRMQLDRQTGLLTNQLADLEGDLADAIEALGLTFFRDKMKEANDKVRELMQERDAETAQRKVGALKNARLATDEAYEKLIEKINAYAIIEGVEDYQTLITQLNETIKRYKQEALGQSSKKDDDKKEEKPTEDPKPENPGEETPTKPETPDEETPTEPTEPQPGVDSDGDGSPEVV